MPLPNRVAYRPPSGPNNGLKQRALTKEHPNEKRHQTHVRKGHKAHTKHSTLIKVSRRVHRALPQAPPATTATATAPACMRATRHPQGANPLRSQYASARPGHTMLWTRGLQHCCRCGHGGLVPAGAQTSSVQSAVYKYSPTTIFNLHANGTNSTIDQPRANNRYCN